MNDYIINFNKGETFRRVITWKDSEGSNMLALANSVVMELSSNTSPTKTVNLSIDGDKITILRDYKELESVSTQVFHIFAEMKSGDRVLILRGVFKAYA